jgi:hypothetical protein
MEEHMVKIKQNLNTVYDRKKSYTDKGRAHREFKLGDHVFLKVKEKMNSLKLGSFPKLETKYCGPFEILGRIGPIEYMLAFPASMRVHNVFHVSLLKKCVSDLIHVIDWTVIQVEHEGDFLVESVCILD